MNNILEILNNNSIFIIIGLVLMVIILLIMNIVALSKIGKIKKRIDKFLKPSSKRVDIEEMLLDYLNQVKEMSDKHSYLVQYIENLNSRVLNCIQRVGMIRYNPFDEVGGDLCYALALLDERNNGVVINSIYSREGCYTYAKPILDGKSEKYKLSVEEEQAVNMAMGK